MGRWRSKRTESWCGLTAASTESRVPARRQAGLSSRWSGSCPPTDGHLRPTCILTSPRSTTCWRGIVRDSHRKSVAHAPRGRARNGASRSRSHIPCGGGTGTRQQRASACARFRALPEDALQDGQRAQTRRPQRLSGPSLHRDARQPVPPAFKSAGRSAERCGSTACASRAALRPQDRVSCRATPRTSRVGGGHYGTTFELSGA